MNLARDESQLLRRVLDRPRAVAGRRFLFQAHLWIGIAIGIYAFVVGITGSVLVFHDELQVAINPRLHRAEVTGGGPPVSPDQAVEAARSTVPGGRVTSVFLPANEGATYRVVGSADGTPMTVAVHPGTGSVLAIDTGRGLLPWIRQLHFNLLSGRAGRVVNGVGGLLMTALCITGVAIWWQGRRHWRRGLKVEWSATWKQAAWGLHSVTGITTVVFLSTLSLTGAYFAWPQVYRHAVSLFAPVAQREASPRATVPEGTPPRPLAELVAAAEAAVPGRKASRITLPEKPEEAVRVMLFEGTSGHGLPSNTVFVNPYSATVLRADLYGAKPTGDLILSWIAPLHFGNFGGFAVKIIWSILGLAPAVLFATGFFVWWNRVIRKRRNGATGPPPGTDRLSELTGVQPVQQ
jgi:uncharacterized iron-regulated membrane protein